MTRNSGKASSIIRRLIYVWLLAILAAGHTYAGSYLDVYDEKTLKYWQTINREDLQYNFDNAILPHLTLEEKQKLLNVKLEFPLVGQSLFDFRAQGMAVVMPILSIRFFSDLALAQAWLEASGYNLSTVQQYVGMLKFNSANQFPGGRYPKPLEALEIPNNARDDPRVKSYYDPIFTTAILFILCHELGHIYYQHPGYSDISMEKARANEAQADRFAVELMRRMGVPPVGAPFWFVSLARFESNRADFKDLESWEEYYRKKGTHPLTPDRMRALAADISASARDFASTQTDPEAWLVKVQTIAGQIEGVADILANKDIQEAFRVEGLMTKPEMLAPRHSATYVVGEHSQSLPETPFSGVYQGLFTSSENPQGFPIRIVLKRKGQDVSGSYSYATATGAIQGKITGKRLYFDWQEGAANGKGQFETDSKGNSFTGSWGGGESDNNGGTWSGKKDAKGNSEAYQ